MIRAVEHGTPSGNAAGCRTNASCPNHRTEHMTCTEAALRYRGDYQYRLAVDIGEASTLSPNPPAPAPKLPKPRPTPLPPIAPEPPALRGRIPKPSGRDERIPLTARQAFRDSLGTSLHCPCGAEFIVRLALEEQLEAEGGLFCPRGHTLLLVEARATPTTKRGTR